MDRIRWEYRMRNDGTNTAAHVEMVSRGQRGNGDYKDENIYMTSCMIHVSHVHSEQ